MKKLLLITGLALSLGMTAQTVEKTYLFDFGGAGSPGSRGQITTESGWNNIAPEGSDDQKIAKHTSFTLTDRSGASDGYKLILTTEWGVNGNEGAGGLMNPDEKLLGDLALATATCDYIFNTNNTDGGRSFVITGLDKNKGYRFTIFGSRDNTGTRKGNYIFSGTNSWFEEMQAAGSGIGANGENQNTSNTPVSDIIFPDVNGNITFFIDHDLTTYVPLNCMKMEVISGATQPELTGTVGKKYYFDFGSDNNSSRGSQTTETGWNNITEDAGANTVTAGKKFENLVDSEGNTTGMALTVNTKFTINGLSGGGGLTESSSDKLGDLAVNSATEDYFFIGTSATPGTMTITGLDQTKTKSYRFYIFGSRKATDTRAPGYKLEGLNVWEGSQLVAGNALDGNTSTQNDNLILVSDPIFPTLDGEITLSVLGIAGTYAPINCMKIEELTGVERPNITTMVEAKLSGAGIAQGENTAFSSRGKNLFDLYVKAGAGTYTITGTDDEDNTSTLEATLKEGINRITVNFNTNEVTVFAIDNFSIEGSTVGGWGPTCQEMDYVGSGVWNFKGELKGYDKSSDSGRIGFIFNKAWTPTFKKVSGSAHDLAEGTGDDIPLNPGTYDITVDLNNMKFYIENGLDELDPYRITMMGSSVANGQGANVVDGYNTGYAYQYDKHLADRYESGESKYPFFISNISIGGNSSVNLLSRFDDMEREFGKWVIYGISLGNEGIHGASNQQAIYDQWVTNMGTLIEQAREQGKEVVVMNNYTRGDFADSDYEYVKKINAEIARWDVPSVNMLGAIDNGKGNWADGYQNGDDVYHPNTAGHTEFFYSMVPSLFDAMLEGKTLTMERDSKASYTLPANTTLEFTPDGTVHSFTLALSVKTADGDLIATIPVAGSETPVTITRSAGNIVALLPDNTTLSVAATSDMDEIELSQNYIRKMISLTVNGQTASETEFEAIAPEKVILGSKEDVATKATSEGITLGEVMFYRSSMHDASPFTEDGKLNKSSLEVYVPVSEKPENMAMSTVTVKLSGIDEEEDDEQNGGTAGIEEVENATFRAYSAISGTISLFSTSPVRVNVANITGQLVFDKEIEGYAEIYGLASGIYIVNGQKIVVK